MSFWILDTDHVSLLLAGNQAVRDRVRPVSRNVALTIVTVQEVFNGWINLINDPAQTENLPELYTRLWIALNYFREVQVINFDDVANDCHQRLLRENKTLNRKLTVRSFSGRVVRLRTKASIDVYWEVH